VKEAEALEIHGALSQIKDLRLDHVQIEMDAHVIFSRIKI